MLRRLVWLLKRAGFCCLCAGGVPVANSGWLPCAGGVQGRCPRNPRRGCTPAPQFALFLLRGLLAHAMRLTSNTSANKWCSWLRCNLQAAIGLPCAGAVQRRCPRNPRTGLHPCCTFPVARPGGVRHKRWLRNAVTMCKTSPCDN